MNTLSIFSPKQGIAFDAETAMRGVAIVEKIATVAAALLRTIRDLINFEDSLRPARA
jgi:hypothetical protein